MPGKLQLAAAARQVDRSILRDDFLHLHAMAMTILEGSPLAVATADVDSIWEKAIALQGDISAYVLDCKQALNTWLLW